MCIYAKRFTVDEDVELSTLIGQFSKLFSEIDPIEVFFSAEFSFYEQYNQTDLYNMLLFGIQSMKRFLMAMQQDINEHCDLCKELTKSIAKLNFSIIPRDMLLINDYVYYPEKNEFEQARRACIIFGQDGIKSRLPLSPFNTNIFNVLGNDCFQKFVTMHAIQQNIELMPTIMIVFQDNTFELDSFIADIKTTIYRKLNETAARILNEDVQEIYFMQVYSACFATSPNLNITSRGRLSIGEKEYLTFMKVDSLLNEVEIIFDGDKLNDMDYIALQILSSKKNKFDLGKANMSLIVDVFRRRIQEKL